MFTKFTNPEKILRENFPGVMPNTKNSGATSNSSVQSTASKPSSTVPPSSKVKTANSNPIPMDQSGFKEEAIPLRDYIKDPILINNSVRDKSYVSDIFKESVNQYMDITDKSTVNILCNLDEAEQNTVLLSLTKKLYNMIVGKIDDIEFGEIPSTKGDITKLSKYKQMVECVDVMRGIFEQYKEKTEPVDVIENAIKNIENQSDLFRQCYAANINLGIVIYNTMTLACINALSYMIAVCIEYVKDPHNDGMKIIMDKTGVAKVKDHLVYENLIKFNDACRQGDIENALRPMIRNRAKGVVISLLGLNAILIIGGVLLAVIPMLRDLVYFFFAARSRVSDYFDLQAKLLEMNANELKTNSSIHTVGDKDAVIRRQLAIARVFHQIADAVAVEAKTSERKATQDIKSDSKKYKIDDVNTDPGSMDVGVNSPSPSSGGSLF